MDESRYTAGRRRFLKSTFASAALLGSQPFAALAGESPNRVALIIGNERYRQAPLNSAVNDAHAMTALLKGAGFSVDERLNATREQSLRAIDEFGRALAASSVELGVFYYAGHAAQLDWRNYLLPVDGNVEAAGDIRKQCVDLGELLGRLGKVKGKTALIVLDACRDDPFGPAYRPAQKGLSQYDAPAGTLLAFATAPGRVAIEPPGGKHGLYTEHLVRELAVKGVRIEDAFKRVRLNVRLASQGRQVPWESTSLESDIYLFPAAKLTEAQLERQFREELERWERIKASRRVEDWADYLRAFPGGKFAEIGQARLVRLLATREEHEKATKAGATGLALNLGPGQRVPPRLQSSDNPHSAGTYPFRPTWTVGDEYVFQYLDLYSGVVQSAFKLVVRRVDLAADRVEFNNGSVTDLMGNTLRGEGRVFDVPIQFNPVEIQLGKKWTSRFQQSGKSQGVGEYTFRVVGRERTKVPAGELYPFKIEGSGWFNSAGTNTSLRITRWLVPGINLAVKQERLQFRDARVLVSAKQRVWG